VTSALLLLIDLTAAVSVAILLVALLRIPLRRATGAQAAYWLWAMVPASVLALAAPAPAPSGAAALAAVPRPFTQAFTGMLLTLTRAPTARALALTVLLVWLAVAAAMLTFAVRRQRAFVRSLGDLALLPNGAYRSPFVREPMVIGALRPRIVLPADFERRYTREECALVLAHEHVHLHRGDVLINALATGWLCLSWFNPLMYWAMKRFRFDQELACDALVLSSTGTPRRRYADALLKTQLATDLAPVGCHWQSNHPLKSRIAALKRPLPAARYRAAGALLTFILVTSGSYAAWAVQPVPHPALAEESTDARSVARSFTAQDSAPVAGHVTPGPPDTQLVPDVPTLPPRVTKGAALPKCKDSKSAVARPAVSG
jgi:bla regulator protein BlaR1